MRTTGRRRDRRGSGIVPWILPLLASVLVCPAAESQVPAASSTTPESPPTGILRIRSEPSGALVRLYGDHRWTGTTPWDLQRGIEGTYRVVAQMDGYEGWERSVTVMRGESRELEIRLSPKQAWKAGIRSLILPGWGQAYSGRETKAGIFMFGTLVLTGGLVWANEDYRDRTDEYRSARRAYFDETSLDELDALRARADRAQQRADRAYDRRRIVMYAAAGAYAASFLDAVLLFPAPSAGSFASVAPWGEHGPEVSLSAPRGELALLLRWTGTEGGAR